MQEQATTRAISTKVPVTTQTTAPPATTSKPAAPSPLLNIVLVIAAIGVLAGGGIHGAAVVDPPAEPGIVP